MAFDAAALAAEKSSDQELWAKVLEGARTSLKVNEVSDDLLARLARASASPERLNNLVRLIYQHGKVHGGGEKVVDVLLEVTNASPFGLNDWADSIAYFHDWLREHDRKIDFISMLRYLECCVAAPEGGQRLRPVVEEMLRLHGYEGK